MVVRGLSPSRVAGQHPKRHATQICPRCRLAFSYWTILVKQIKSNNKSNQIINQINRGGSVRRRCWRHQLTGLEQCMTMDRQACSQRQHETAGEGYEMLATPRVSTRGHSLEVAHERWFNRAVTSLYPFCYI